MKTITLWQPWASLIASGAKCIETRSWPTRYRGPLAIHAAKRLTPEAVTFIAIYREFIERHCRLEDMPQQAVVATCELVSVRRIAGYTDEGPVLDADPVTPDVLVGDLGAYLQSDHAWAQEQLFGDYTPGRYAWLLRGVQPIENPVQIRGAQGLWEWKDATVPRPALTDMEVS